MGIRLVVAVAVLWCARAWADKPPPLDEAIKQAAAAKKPLVIEFGASWCGPCKTFDARVLPDHRVKAALASVWFVQYDAEDDVGSPAAARLKVTGYPTFVVLDGKGIEAFRDTGAPGVAEFVALLDRAKREVLDEAVIRSWVKDKPYDVAAQMTAAHWFATHKKTTDAIALYERLSLHKLATTDQRAAAARALVRLRRLEQWKAQLVAEKAALIRAAPGSTSDDDLTLVSVGASGPDRDTRALVKAVLEARAAQASEDPEFSELNHLVYVALAANANDEALAAAQQLVGYRRTAQYLDTLAECYHARGDRKKALEVADEAIAKSNQGSLSRTLLLNRQRFEAGTGTVSDVVELRARVAELWKRVDQIDKVPEADRQAQIDDEMRRVRTEMMNQMKAERELAVSIAQACRAKAADNEEAIARIEFGSDGAIKSSVLLLEPNAPPALRDCLAKQLAGAKLTGQPSRPKTKLTIELRQRP
jgi:thiol-disulfide isomerase/thioredoxin